MVFSDMHHFIGELAKKLRRGSSVLRISIRFELVAVPDFVVHSLIGYGNELLSDKLSQKVQWAFLMNVPLLRQQKIPMLIGIESFRLAIEIGRASCRERVQLWGRDIACETNSERRERR